MNRKRREPKVLKNLDKVNVNKKIKIRYKNLTSGNYSLYLDLWYKGKRKYNFLNIYLKGTRDSYTEDINKLKVATSIRDEKETELFKDKTGFRLSNAKLNANFVKFLDSIVFPGKAKRNIKKATINHLKYFTGGKVKIKNIDKDFCKSFKQYLEKHLSQNTINSYFGLFKFALNKLVEEEIIPKSPAKYIKLKRAETQREFLTIDELKLLKKTECENEDVKRAFIFSCYTGLRISDIERLTFSQINDGYLTYKQKKTDSPERVKISDNAVKIIEKQEKINTKKVFNLPSYNTIKKKLLAWVKKAGIDKHITFHCARHTFATMCLTYDIDIYTVSKLLGHKDIKTTQIYAKLIDKKKDEAVDKLPQI